MRKIKNMFQNARKTTGLEAVTDTTQIWPASQKPTPGEFGCPPKNIYDEPKTIIKIHLLSTTAYLGEAGFLVKITHQNRVKEEGGRWKLLHFNKLGGK